MRIAYFLNEFPVLSQTFILNQITGMIDSGSEVHIIAFRKISSDKTHDLVRQYELLNKVTYLDLLPPGKFSASLRILSLIFSRRSLLNPFSVFKAFNKNKRIQGCRSLEVVNDILQLEKSSYDIIHCQFGTIATRVLNMIESGKLEGKLVTSFRGYDATKYAVRYPGIYTRLFKKGDCFLPVSQSLKQSIIELGCPENKIKIMHSGLRMDKFNFQEKKLPVGSPVKVLTIARLVGKKGINYAIEAVAKAIAAGKNIHYLIVGEGPMKADLQDLVSQLGINAHVEFLGAKAHVEVIGLLNECHILVAPSITAADGDKEGIPNVMKEAMATGLPVIGTRHGGIPELVEHKKSGLLVDEKNDEQLSQMLIYMCEHPEVWSNICGEAREVIEDRFDIIQLNKNLYEIYKTLTIN